MPRGTLIAELKMHLDQTVELRGWAHAIRDQKSMQFLVLRDETGLAQLVLRKEDPPASSTRRSPRSRPSRPSPSPAQVVADERVKLGGLEIQLASLTSILRPSPNCRSRPSRRWTSASTGAISTCAGPTGV